MPAPIIKLKKDEIVKLSTKRCKHGHTYLDHYSCYLKQEQHPLRIGFLDIETSNLAADYGIIFCYAIKVFRQRTVVGRVITPEELHSSLDKNVVKQLIEDMQKFDMLVTYYGTGFDIPFIRTRAVNLGLEFPPFGSIQHKDIYYAVKGKFKMSRKSLENASKVLVGTSHKTHWMSEHWIKALQGNEESLLYIYDHCLKDVFDTEALYNKVIPFMKNGSKSI